MKRIVLNMLMIAGMAVWAAPDAGAQGRVRGFAIAGMDDQTKLGVALQDVTPQLKEKKKVAVDEGAYVSEVVDESPAEKAGIEQGDVIVSFDGKAINDADDLTRAVKRARTDEPVSIGLNRNGEKKTLSVKLRKPSRSKSYSYSFGGHGDHGIAVVPPVPPRPFRFNMMVSQSVEGMEVQKLSKQLAEYFEVPGGRGLLVTEVEKRSAAADAGIKAGDVIVKVNASPVKDVGDLREELSEQEEGSARIDILRKGKPQTVTLKTEGREIEEEEEEDDDDLSIECSAPPHLHFKHSSSHGTFSGANRVFLRDLHETLSQIEERIREKVERIHERISDNVLNM